MQPLFKARAIKSILILSLLSTLSAMLAGCATQARYEDYLAQYHGISEQQLQQIWGTPTRSIDDGQIKYLTYFTRGQTMVMVAPAIYQPYFDGKNVHQRIVQAERWEQRTVQCETTFQLQNDAVVQIHYQGNGCVPR